MKQKQFFYLLAFCILLAFVLAVGKDHYLRALGSFLVVKDDLRPADVIVVLGGEDRGRVDQAVKLYKEGFSKWIIMTGHKAHPLTNIAEQMRQEAVQEGVPAERILLEPKAEHTYQHPIFVKPILADHGFRSAIVVSSPYHMRRASMLFDHEFDKTGIKLSYYPDLKNWFDAQHWWQSKAGRGIVFLEYVKMAVNFWGTGVNDLTCALIRKYKGL